MDWIVVLAGLVVGILVGVTGVGGGSLMTPFLLFYGVPPTVAVGSDLAYAAVAKGFGVWLRHRVQAINWRVAGLLMLGSLPASALVIGVVALEWLGWRGIRVPDHARARGLPHRNLGDAAVGHPPASPAGPCPELQGRLLVTITFGALLGAMVTLSSVGSGAIGTAVLLLLYPRWPVATVVGTDLAYAVPLTATAALGHLFLGHVDWLLTASLVLGAVPGMFIGTRLGVKLREGIVRGVLGALLLGIGVRFLFY
ncbi:MAG: sulfite exporter TauE/SafE family protein [Halofilum sp. (in: g-proteobacteria)]|nr:sulfite exporter TauE/SafE family protein [Halofilum sp. (in: g-proteobacteria)]